MKATIEITDSEIEGFIKKSIGEKFASMSIDAIIEARLSLKVSEAIKRKISDEKIENFTRDRISRIITTESLKEFTEGITADDVLSNLESKVLLMIKNSADFKSLVKSVLKNSL